MHTPSRVIPYVYQLSLATYQINYGFEGQVNGYITGGYPAQDQDGNSLSPTDKAVPSIPNVAESPGGYIWDGVRKAGLTYRNYGFFLSSGTPSIPPFKVPDNYPTVAGLSPPGHIPTPDGQVAGYSDYDYRKFDFNYADSDAWLKYGFDAASLGLTTGNPPGYYASPNSPVPPQPSRFSEWNREFQEMLKQDPTGDSVPAFMTVRFGRDHTMGLNPGFGSPGAMMADNDYAVGELVEAVSKSPIWKSTVIFVVEDDSQFSPDHVDTHRSFAQVISPWIKKSTVDSRFYDTNSVLKSMELLLGLSPMSQYDHFANPIMGGWDSAPNNDAVYTAILPPKNIIGEVNPSMTSYAPNDPRRRLAELSSTDELERCRCRSLPGPQRNPLERCEGHRLKDARAAGERNKLFPEGSRRRSLMATMIDVRIQGLGVKTPVPRPVEAETKHARWAGQHPIGAGHVSLP